MRYRVHAEAETPLAISVRRAAGNDLNTLTYLPGTVVRGALAAAYLTENDANSAGFRDLFLDRKVRYGDLRAGDARPWPLSVRQCSGSPDDHSKIDLLIREAAKEAAEQECHCKEKLEPPRGFYRYKSAEGRPPGYYGERIHTHRQAHSEIDPRFLKTRPGQFHSAQLIDQGQTFEGFIDAATEAKESLVALIGDGRSIHVGRGRSRGQGRVRVSISPEERQGPECIEEKVRLLNEHAAGYDALNNLVVFSCTLDSNTILYDRWLFSRSFLEPTDISPELNTREYPYTLLACFRSMLEIPGWHTKGGVPKGDVPMIAAGSCFLFGRVAPPDRGGEFRRLATIFAAVESTGLGERLEEGFGEVTFCRTLHTTLKGHQ